MYIKQHRYVKL